MSKYILLNDVNLLGTLLKSGKVIDDAQYSATTLQNAGAVLWPASDAVASAAALFVQNRQASQGKSSRFELLSEFLIATTLLGLESGASYAPALKQAAWWIDPANSTSAANDSNPGTQALPLLTHAELERRRSNASILSGGRFPILQDTTVTYLSTPATPDADPVRVRYKKVGTFTLKYVGFLTTVRSSTLTGTTPALAGQVWNLTDGVNPFTNADVGLLFTDTVAGTRCWVDSQSAGVATVGEPLASLSGAPVGFATVPALTAPGNHAYTMSSMPVVRLAEIDGLTEGIAETTFRTIGVSFYHFAFHATGAGMNNVQIRGDIDLNQNYSTAAFYECAFQGQVNLINPSYSVFVNCYNANSYYPVGGVTYFVGGNLTGVFGVSAWVLVDGGAYIRASGQIGDSFFATQAQVGLVSMDPTATFRFVVNGSRVVFHSGFFSRLVRGGPTSNIMTLQGGAIAACAAWAATFAGVTSTNTLGTFDGVTTLSNWIVSTQSWDATPPTVTPAHLDAANGAGTGFGGVAANPVTGTRLLAA